MRKILGLMAAIVLGSTTTLQVVACSDDSKFQDFKTHVNNNETFFGVLGIKNNPDEKALTDGLTAMQSIPPTGGNSDWQNYLESATVKPALDKNNTKINIFTFEREPFADESKTSADDFWNDSSITWQKNIYHWLIDHKTDKNYYTEPVTDSATNPIPPYPSTDKERKFTSLPIIFIVNREHLLTVGGGWDTKNITNQQQFFTKFTNLISGNLLDKL